MTWQQKAKVIHQYGKKKWKPWGVEDRRFLALSLAGEVGEVCNLIKKEWRGDKESRRNRWIMAELGDAAVYLELLRIAFGADFERTNGPKLMRLARKKWPETLRHLRAAEETLRMLNG